MSIRVYNLEAGGGTGTIPTLQEVTEAGNTTNVGILFDDVGSTDITIVSSLGVTTASSNNSASLLNTGKSVYTNLNGSGILVNETTIDYLAIKIADTPVGINNDSWYYATVSDQSYFKSTFGSPFDAIYINSGNGTNLLPEISFRKIQGGGQSIVKISNTASSNIAESYLPYDTTNNGSTFQIRNTISGTITLVAGVATLSNSNVKSISLLQVSLKTPGGVMGVNYQITLSGTTFTVKSVDQTGATVATDTSTLDYLLQF